MEILSLPENEPFITGIEESIDICSNQIMKLADASIFHCRSGKAHIEIDLQAYEVTENTQLLLLPGSIFGTFIKYYKISQLIHTQSIAN